MKGIVSALSLFPNAGASLINIFLSPLAKDPTFTFLYAAAAAGCILASIIFFLSYRVFDQEDYEMKHNNAATDDNISEVEIEVEETMRRKWM